jgi:glucokinase
VAVDVGGTKIAAALISGAGEILAREYRPTCASRGPEAVIERILGAIDRLISKAGIPPSQLAAIGIAAAGALDVERGLVTASPNLPGWRDVPLRDIVQSRQKVTTFIINDANAAALGEHYFGAGRGTRHMIFLTVSTGIGGGIILNGQLYSGASGAAGEIGHMTIDADGPPCKCGNRGCLEALASGWAIAEDALSRIQQGEKSRVMELTRGKLENVTAQVVHSAAQQGDPLAQEVIRKAARFLGVGLANLVNIFNPERIVVGGGVARMGEMLLEPAREVVAERAFTLLVRRASIVAGELGDDAGVLGAAAFFLKTTGQAEVDPG